MRYRNTSTCWWSSRNRISTSHNPNFELQPRQLMSPYQDHRFSTKVHPRTSCNSSNPSLSQTSGHLRLRLKFEPRNLPSSNLNKLCTESRNKRRKSQRRLRVSRTISFSWKVRRNKDSRWALTANRRSFSTLFFLARTRQSSHEVAPHRKIPDHFLSQCCQFGILQLPLRPSSFNQSFNVYGVFGDVCLLKLGISWIVTDLILSVIDKSLALDFHETLEGSRGIEKKRDR